MKDLQSRINDVAKILEKEGRTFTRSDLAYQLQNDGAKDDIELEREVYLARQRFKFSDKVFLTNDRKRTLEDAYKLCATLQNKGNAEADVIISLHLSNAHNSIMSTKRALSIQVPESALKTANGIMNTINGTKGVEKVRAEADIYFRQYTKMVDAYENAKANISFTIDDYAAVRTVVQNLFLQYASALTDIFGDSVKVISPQMFDLSCIEWLDVSRMAEQIQLDYSTITTRCGELFTVISDNFRNSLQASSGVYKQSGDKRVGLALAGLNMLSHYLDAGERTAELRTDLAKLQKSISRDQAQIKGDLMRLTALYKQLNDVNIPKAMTFNKHSEALLAGGLKSILDALYKNPQAKKRKEERDELLSVIRELSLRLNDLQAQITSGEARLAENNKMLKAMQPQYSDAKDTKPGKPFFLFNLLTFGALGRSYRRDMFDWSKRCMPVVQSYEDLELDVKLDSEDLQKYKNQLKESKKEFAKLKNQLDRINKDMMSLVQADDATKRQMLSSLKDILRLLLLAKEITDSKLDDSIAKVAKIREADDFQLPAEINRGIDKFMDTLSENLRADANVAACIVDNLGVAELTPQNVGTPYSDEDLNVVAEQSNQALQQGVSLARKMIELQKAKLDTQSAQIHYNKELERLQKQFSAQVETLNRQSNDLLEIMRELNLANSQEDVRAALIKLSEGKLNMPSDEDLEKFMKGEKLIEI